MLNPLEDDGHSPEEEALLTELEATAREIVQEMRASREEDERANLDVWLDCCAKGTDKRRHVAKEMEVDVKKLDYFQGRLRRWLEKYLASHPDSDFRE